MMQINLTGFLNGRNARVFMQELWDLLLSAQESVGMCCSLNAHIFVCVILILSSEEEAY